MDDELAKKWFTKKLDQEYLFMKNKIGKSEILLYKDKDITNIKSVTIFKSGPIDIIRDDVDCQCHEEHYNEGFKVKFPSYFKLINYNKDKNVIDTINYNVSQVPGKNSVDHSIPNPKIKIGCETARDFFTKLSKDNSWNFKVTSNCHNDYNSYVKISW